MRGMGSLHPPPPRHRQEARRPGHLMGPLPHTPPRRNPLDARHFYTISMCGFLISIIVLGDGEDKVSVQEHSAGSSTDPVETAAQKDVAANASAFAVFPMFAARFCDSLWWRHVLVATFPKDLIMFDLQHETGLSFPPPLAARNSIH